MVGYFEVIDIYMARKVLFARFSSLFDKINLGTLKTCIYLVNKANL